GSKWYNGNASNPGPTGWLRYDFGSGNAQVIKRYTVNSADVANRDPKSWQFQGSNDGSTWTTLDTQSSQTFADRSLQKTYNIGNTTAYRYYQINVTANNGAGSLAISELGLWSDQGVTVQNGIYRVVNRRSNKVLDVANNGTADGSNVDQWTWNSGNNQKWTVTSLGNGQYQAMGVGSGKLIEVAGASLANGANVDIFTSNNNNCQKWTITPAGDGFFKFLNVNSGKAVDVSGGSTADGANVIQWPYSAADNQLWQLSLTP
ncbi:MAG: RICIN domain-containing protein, partial [Verrucomicrobia bacterium]|nr:RICIN domain-containing protein [Verrucomicrobiota bacterium]